MSNGSHNYYEVDPPQSVPYSFGLFSAVEPRSIAESHWRLGVTWKSQNCTDVKKTFDDCLVDETVEPKMPDAACSVSEFEPFTLYAYNDDPIPGESTMGTNTDNAIYRLTRGEQYAAESHLWYLLNSAITSTFDATAQKAKFGLAVIEQQLAELYGSQGVIHMNRLTATILRDELSSDGDKLFTKLGTPVVAGGGYRDTSVPISTLSRIIGTGPLVVIRGDIDTNAYAMNYRKNKVSVIAEREYVIGWDCVTVAADVQLDIPSS